MDNIFDKTGMAEINTLSGYIELLELYNENKHAAIYETHKAFETCDVELLKKADRMRTDYIFRGEGGYYSKRVAGAFRLNCSEFKKCGECKKCEDKEYCQAYNDSQISLYPDFRIAADEYYRAIAHKLDETEKGDFIAFAQHHWLPTNLLDVTSSPLAALFMACDKDSYNLRGELAKNIEPAYVYIFEDYIDVTDIMNACPNNTVVDLLIQSNPYAVNKMCELIEGYCRQFSATSKFMIWMKNVCKNIYAVTKEIKGEGIVDNYHTQYKDISEKAKAISDSEICDVRIETLFQELMQSIEDNIHGVQLPIHKSNMTSHELTRYYLTFLVFYLQRANSQKSEDFMPYMIFKPKISFERARLQQGFFIVQPFKTIDPNDSRIRLIQEIEHSKTIKINNPELILRQLDYIGVNHGTMYGDFDSIAKYINSKRKVFKV